MPTLSSPFPASGLRRFHLRFVAAASSLRPAFLLFVRCYWGCQFALTGWGKLHHLPQVSAYFASLGIPGAGVQAPLVALLEFAGGVLLLPGLGSRPLGLLLAGDMAVAYLAADRPALAAVLSDPGTFYAAAPYTFLFASLIILIFAPGPWSVDQLIWRD